MFSKFPSMTAAAVIALAFIGAAMYFSNFSVVWRDSLAFIFGGSAGNKQAAVLVGAVGDNPYLGRGGAKVTIVEFYDFQCPSCLLFHFGAENVILDEYVKKGLALVVYRDFPFLGEESLDAAYAARCANEQGKFFEYRDGLFALQAKAGAENSNQFSYSHLLGLAEEVGMNKNLLESCFSAGKYKDAVARDLSDGKAAGVTATPTVFINGQKLEGSFPFEAYQKIIEEELKK